MIVNTYKSLARKISIVENDLPEAEAILQSLVQRDVPVIGVTGPPGAGKSTLVNHILQNYLEQGKRIGVLLIDPSSPFHHGALLGDRVRMSEHFLNGHVYIRSLATRGSLGGLSDKIIEITDVMRAEDFDLIVIETVGVGQSEIEIAGLADITIMVLVPEAGDEIQHMKSGVMEIGDIYVINKADRPEADRFATRLQQYLRATHSHYDAPVLKTIAQDHVGIEELIHAIDSVKQTKNSDKKAYLYLQKALHLIKNKRMKGIDAKKMYEDIVVALMRDKHLNIYLFIQRYL